ncbi:zinc-dependent metalloprotease [Aquimarina agarivorans]|uniref:zinc-dependent metalloprotease n=1 Tax=Aquimarina agarivorans TaxID=980584 RepID=UPI000248E85E|nr:T9SS type A sorting domain-containing protein [Aquimarina agarivorans]
MNFNKGDVISLSSDTSSIESLSLFLPNGDKAIETNNLMRFSPDNVITNSPVTFPTNNFLTYNIPENGEYIIQINLENQSTDTNGNYDLNVVASRPGYEIKPGTKSIIYLDFSGEKIDTEIFKMLSPSARELFDIPTDTSFEFKGLEHFLQEFEIENSKNNLTKLAYKITNQVKKQFNNANLAVPNPDFNVTFISDFGNPFLGKYIPKLLDKFNIDYNTVFIGGVDNDIQVNDVSRLFNFALGFTFDYDPGNFSNTDTAFISINALLNRDSIGNTIQEVELAENAIFEDFLALNFATTISHEIGHFLGLLHTRPNSSTFSIMDVSASFKRSAGVINEQQFGDPANVFPSFEPGIFVANESTQGTNLVDFNLTSVLGFKKPNTGAKLVLDEQGNAIQEIEQMEQKLVTSLDNSSLSSDFTIYTDIRALNKTINISFNQNIEGDINVAFYDMKGSRVFQKAYTNRNTISIIPSSFGIIGGAYVCRVISENKIRTEKLIIE